MKEGSVDITVVTKDFCKRNFFHLTPCLRHIRDGPVYDPSQNTLSNNVRMLVENFTA